MKITMCMLIKDILPIQEFIFNSIQNCKFDEYLIGIDDRSTKETYDLIEQYGFNYFKLHFEDFSQARNEIIKRAKTERCFFIDSDETIDSKHIDIVRDYILKYPERDGFLLTRKHWKEIEMKNLVFDMREKPDYQTRILNTTAVKFICKVHERFNTSNILFLPDTVWLNHFNFAIRTQEDWHRINMEYKHLGKI